MGIPADVWCGRWVPERTIMLRKTSKAVQAAMDTMMLPAVVRANRWFWCHSQGTPIERWGFILQQLLTLTGRCRITTLDLMCGVKMDMTGLGVKMDMTGLVGVLALCAGGGAAARAQ